MMLHFIVKPRRMRWNIVLIILGVVLAGAVGYFAFVSKSTLDDPFGGKADFGDNPNDRIAISASFYPLAEFAKNIGGENVQVINITPAGAEPHNYEPSPQEIARIYSSKIFLYNGAGLDPWAEKISSEVEKKGVVSINMTQFFELLRSEKNHEKKPNSDKKNLDPHIWLDPTVASRMVETIRNALVKIDPSNTAAYFKNTREYQDKLFALDQKYQKELAFCEIHYIVASHRAFDYMAKHYNINVISIAGISPEEEPSPKWIAEIARLASEKKIQYIFFETLASPKLAETIAREIRAETLVFNPIEGLTDAEIASGENYVSLMEKNLKNLQTALICK